MFVVDLFKSQGRLEARVNFSKQFQGAAVPDQRLTNDTTQLNRNKRRKT
jgi:hypothetical protein